MMVEKGKFIGIEVVNPDSEKAFFSGNPEFEQNKGKIDQLCAVVKTRYRRRLFLIGWTSDGRPTISDDEGDLTGRAQKSLFAFRRSGLEIKEINYPKLIPVEYFSTEEPIDFKSEGPVKAEDLLSYKVRMETGESTNVLLGEHAVLEAIVEARKPWQGVIPPEQRKGPESVKSMYTLFVATPEMNGEAALAILFKPTFEGGSNEPKFKRFVRQTISQLVYLDESQKSDEERKGYIWAAAKHAGEKGKNPLQVLFALQKTGFIEFDEDFFDNLGSGTKGLIAGGLKIARGLGLVDFEDKWLERFRELPYYDLDKLDVNKLLDLASDMQEVARKALRK